MNQVPPLQTPLVARASSSKSALKSILKSSSLPLLGVLLTCAGVVSCGILWHSYLSAGAGPDVPLAVPPVIELGELVYEPTLGFEFPFTNRSREPLRVLVSSDCSCVKLQTKLLSVELGSSAMVRGELLLSRVRDPASLDWRFARDILLETDPLGGAVTVSLQGTVVEPLRVADDSALSMTIDPEDDSTLEKSFPAWLHSGFELQGISAGGYVASLKPSDRAVDTDLGQEVELTIRCQAPYRLPQKKITSVEAIFEYNGKHISQRIPANIEVLKPLRVETNRLLLGILSAGKQQIRIPYRFAEGIDGRIVTDQIALGTTSVDVREMEGALELEFSVTEGPPQNVELHLPFVVRQPGNSSEELDEVVIPVSYSCL